MAEPKAGDVVVPLGALGEGPAAGYGRRTGIPVIRALAEEDGRWSALPGPVADRSVVLVAPLLAQGGEVRAGVVALRGAGAREVHVRIGAPPVRAECRFGQLGPTTDELALASRTPAEVADWLGADTLVFGAALPPALSGDGWCRACLGEAPPMEREETEDQLTLF